MLPEILKHEASLYEEGPEWNNYLNRIGKYNQLNKYFLSQICFEHFSRFNEYFPDFDIYKNNVISKKVKTIEIYEKVRYDHNEKLDSWYFQIDDYLANRSNLDYEVLKYCCSKYTWPFPPVIIEKEKGEKLGCNYALGEPWHLVEGTHRVSFINRLFELKRIGKDSMHEILWIE